MIAAKPLLLSGVLLPAGKKKRFFVLFCGVVDKAELAE